MAIDDRDLSTLVSSAGLVLVGQLLYSFSKLGERIIITRALTPAAYGEISIGIAILSVGTIVALVGLSQGVPRYMSRFEEDRDKRGAWATGLLIAVTLGVVLASLLAVNAGRISDLLFEGPSAPRLIVLFAAALPLVIGMRLGISALRGLENTRYRTYTRDLLYPGLRLAVLAALLATGAGVLAAGYAYLVAAAVTFVGVHLLLNRLLPLVGEARFHTREMLTFSMPLVVSTLLSRLLTRTDTVMLGYFRPSAEVGLYSAAFPLAGALSMILASFGYIYFPMASRLDAAGEHGEIDSVYKLTTKWIFILTFPAFLTLVVFPGDVLSIVFGAEYAPAAMSLAILSLGFFTRATFGRSKETVSALGYTTYLLGTNAFAFVLNVGLNLVLIPRYGPNGAAVASAVSFLGLNLAVFSLLKFRFGISPFSAWSLRSMVVLPVALGPPALLLAARVDLTLLTLVAFAALAVVGTLVVVALTGCLQSEDEIPIRVVEERVGVEVPYVRRFIPES